MSADRTRTIDSDVHCVVPESFALEPYLEPHWQEFLHIGHFKAPAGVDAAYPPWLPMLETNAADVTLDSVRSTVLARADHAILNCYYALEGFTHPYFADGIARAVNRWMATEWLDADDRLFGTAVVTPQHVEAAVDQIAAIAEDPRFVQILVPERSPEGYGKRRYWPIWRAAAERGLAVAIGYGGATGTPYTPLGLLGSFFEDYGTATLNFQSQILSLVSSGIFSEIPDLRFVILESGWTWAPSWMWRMDQEWKAVQREVPWMTEPPTHYVRKHFRFTSDPIDAPPASDHLQQVLKHLGGPEMLMYGSDFPHTYRDDTTALLAGLAPEDRERILWSNANEWYGLDARVGAATPAS